MERIEITLPRSLRGIRYAYVVLSSALSAFVALGLLTELGDSYLAARSLLEVALLMAFAAGPALLFLEGLWAFARSLSRARPAWPSRLARAATILGLLLLAAIDAVILWGNAGFSNVFLVFPFFFAALYIAAEMRLEAPAPLLILDEANLELREGQRRRLIPLESIQRVAREPGWPPRFLAGGQPLPALSELTPAEREWLIDLIEAHAQRKRGALARQGHDLAAPAEPPAHLLAQMGRS